jgi:hypothetical protein
MSDLYYAASLGRSARLEENYKEVSRYTGNIPMNPGDANFTASRSYFIRPGTDTSAKNNRNFGLCERCSS